MAKKYLYLWVLQGHYGHHGWEDLTASERRWDVVDDRKAYRENEGGNYRIIQRREPNPEYENGRAASNGVSLSTRQTKLIS